MSSRTIRKLCGNSQQLPPPGDESSEDDGPSYRNSSKPNINPFLALQQTDSDDDDETSDDVSDEMETEQQIATGARKKKKPQKKLKKKQKKVDDIDKIVEHILGDDPPLPPDPAPAYQVPPVRLLNIKLRNLNPLFEWLNIFGAEAVYDGPKKPRKRSLHWIKHSNLVTPKDHWGPLQKVGLSVILVNVKNDIYYFKYEHSSEYQRIEKTLLHYMEANDHESIRALQATFPFHLDCLLQMFFQYFVLDEDFATAYDLLEKALYYLEYVLPLNFNFTLGNCRFEYIYQENRTFHIALLKRVQYLGDKAAHRTALEVAKLAISLDRTDPVAICLVIDIAALRSQQYEWLVRAIEVWNAERNVLGLVNMTFSYALANYHLKKKGTMYQEPDRILEDALIRFPCVLVHIFANYDKNPGDDISQHKLFNEVGRIGVPVSLWHLARLYAERSWQLWRMSDVEQWLIRCARGAIARFDANDPLVNVGPIDNKRLYARTPVNVLRHFIVLNLHDYPLVQRESPIPLCLIRHIDPIPPTEGINIYPNTAMQALRAQTNALAEFLQTMMPRYNIRELVQELFNSQQQGEEGGGVA